MIDVVYIGSYFWFTHQYMYDIISIKNSIPCKITYYVRCNHPLCTAKPFERKSRNFNLPNADVLVAFKIPLPW